MTNLQNYLNSWGLCWWFTEQDLCLFAPESIEILTNSSLHNCVFHCIGIEQPYLLLAYGDIIIKAEPSQFKQVKPLKFNIGDHVSVNTSSDKIGYITDISWHYKENKPLYFLMINGKRVSRRYDESELNLLKTDLSEPGLVR